MGAEEGGAAPPARVVVRRELGTISPINVYLKPPSSVAKHAEQAIRLTCMEEPGSLSTYVMKVSNPPPLPHHSRSSDAGNGETGACEKANAEVISQGLPHLFDRVCVTLDMRFSCVVQFNKKDDSFAGVLSEMQKRIEEASAGGKA